VNDYTHQPVSAPPLDTSAHPVLDDGVPDQIDTVRYIEDPFNFNGNPRPLKAVYTMNEEDTAFYGLVNVIMTGIGDGQNLIAGVILPYDKYIALCGGLLRILELAPPMRTGFFQFPAITVDGDNKGMTEIMFLSQEYLFGISVQIYSELPNGDLEPVQAAIEFA
jgi:hypothetical protein